MRRGVLPNKKIKKEIRERKRLGNDDSENEYEDNKCNRWFEIKFFFSHPLIDSQEIL